MRRRASAKRRRAARPVSSGPVLRRLLWTARVSAVGLASEHGGEMMRQAFWDVGGCFSARFPHFCEGVLALDVGFSVDLASR